MWGLSCQERCGWPHGDQHCKVFIRCPEYGWWDSCRSFIIVLSNMGKKRASSGHSPIPRGLGFFCLFIFCLGVCLGLFLIACFQFCLVCCFLFCLGFWVFFVFECVEDILVTLFIIIIFWNGLSYKDSLVLLWGTDDYIFQELHWKNMCCMSKENWFCV